MSIAQETAPSSPDWTAEVYSERPWWRLLVLGGLLLISFVNYVVLRNVAPPNNPAAANMMMDLPFLQVWIISFLPYALACAYVLATRPSTGRWLAAELGIILTGAALFRLLLLPVPPVLSRDSWRYLWDARVTLSGFSPYVYKPVDPAVRFLVDNILFPNMRYRTAPTIYPPGAQFVFLISYLIARSNLDVLKLIFFLCDMTTCAALMLLLRRKGIDARRALLYAWSPLPIIEYATNGHVDVITLTATLLALMSATSTTMRGRILTGFLIGFAALTKIYPILLLAVIIPDLLRETSVNGRIVLSRIRGSAYALVLTCLLTVAIGYLPYLILGHGQVLGYFTTYANEQGLDAGPINLALQWLGARQRLTLTSLLTLEHIVEFLSIGVATLIVFVLRLRNRLSREWATLLLFGVVLAVSSHIFPWYTPILLLWVPLLSSTSVGAGVGRMRGGDACVARRTRRGEHTRATQASPPRIRPAPAPTDVAGWRSVRRVTLAGDRGDSRRATQASPPRVRPAPAPTDVAGWRSVIGGLSGKGLAIIAVWYFTAASIFSYFPVTVVTKPLSEWSTYYLIAYKLPAAALGVAALVGIINRLWHGRGVSYDNHQ